MSSKSTKSRAQDAVESLVTVKACATTFGDRATYSITIGEGVFEKFFIKDFAYFIVIHLKNLSSEYPLLSQYTFDDPWIYRIEVRQKTPSMVEIYQDIPSLGEPCYYIDRIDQVPNFETYRDWYKRKNAAVTSKK